MEWMVRRMVVLLMEGKGMMGVVVEVIRGRDVMLMMRSYEMEWWGRRRRGN